MSEQQLAPSLAVIASVLGVSKSTVWRDVQKAGGSAGRVRGSDGRTYPSTREALTDEVTIALQALENGRSLPEVAEIIGVSPRTVRRWRSQDTYARWLTRTEWTLVSVGTPDHGEGANQAASLGRSVASGTPDRAEAA